jgi:hypothetical protein
MARIGSNFVCLCRDISLNRHRHLYSAPPSHYRRRIMNIFSDVAKELLNIFMADARLALSILGLVVFISLLIKVAGIAPCWQAAVF